MERGVRGIEWPTLLVLAGCYLLWILGITVLSTLYLPLGMLAVAVSAALHSSLQHEIIHHHPFRSDRLNELLVLPALTLVIPYRRFRDTHLAHHVDDSLTDPYDDPESNYLDPQVWARLPAPVRAVLRINNTLLGRILIGPVIGQVAFMADDLRRFRAGNRSIAWAWVLHIPAAAIVVAALVAAPIPLWAGLLATYAALGILKIRTYLEHRAFSDTAGRTAIVEDRGPLAFLFLNNNFHAVHHRHPGVPWYGLPALYRSRREAFLAANHGYRYDSYGEVFSRHLLRAKDPVPHPLMPAALDLPPASGAINGTREEGRHVPASDHRNGGLHAL